MNGDFGLNGGYHGFSHHGEREELVSALKKIEGFQVSMMSYLIDLLKKEDDLINGGSLFDNTAILYGCGMATGTHSTKTSPWFWQVVDLSMANTKYIPKRMESVCQLLIYYSVFYSRVVWKLISLVPVQAHSPNLSGVKLFQDRLVCFY